MLKLEANIHITPVKVPSGRPLSANLSYCVIIFASISRDWTTLVGSSIFEFIPDVLPQSMSGSRMNFV